MYFLGSIVICLFDIIVDFSIYTVKDHLYACTLPNQRQDKKFLSGFLVSEQTCTQNITIKPSDMVY